MAFVIVVVRLFVCFLNYFFHFRKFSSHSPGRGGERQRTTKGSVCSSGAFLLLEIQSVTGLHQVGQAADQELQASSVSTSCLVQLALTPCAITPNLVYSSEDQTWVLTLRKQACYQLSHRPSLLILCLHWRQGSHLVSLQHFPIRFNYKTQCR